MISNVCKIEKGTKDLAAILKESEKVAIYNELDRKQTLHLRLICEELDGMLPELIGDFRGKFWIEFEDGVCKVNASITMDELSTERRKELLGISNSKKNAAAVGIVGKIRSAVESLFLNDEYSQAFAMSAACIDATSGYYMGTDYSHYWSLGQYKNSVKAEDKREAWDELEKSVIATIADDVIVGIKGIQADIIVIKKFA